MIGATTLLMGTTAGTRVMGMHALAHTCDKLTPPACTVTNAVGVRAPGHARGPEHLSSRALAAGARTGPTRLTPRLKREELSGAKEDPSFVRERHFRHSPRTQLGTLEDESRESSERAL